MVELGELSEAERLVWEAFPRGSSVDLSTVDQDRTVRARVLVALLLGAREAEPGQVARLVLSGARIDGPLDLSDTEITVPIALTGCHFGEEVTVANAHLRRLDLAGSRLVGLNATQAHIDGDLMLRRSQVRGRVELAGAHIGGVLQLNHAQLANPDGWALHAARLVIDHSIYCAHFLAEGGIYLVGARIGGGVHMLDARLRNADGDALEISRSTIDDDINLIDGCIIEGCLRMVQTHVRGQINMSGARLANTNGPALIADNLTVDQNLYCAKLTAEAEIRLLGAHVAGDFVLSGARLDNPNGDAIDAGSLAVDRGMQCNDGFIANGGIRLLGARLGVLELIPAQPVTGDIDLRDARVAVMRDDPTTPHAVAHLDGFGYDELHPLLDVRSRLAWLGRQPDGYRPRPYEQLAAAYRRLGHDADARRVLLAKQRRRRATLTFPARAWGVVQDWTVGYGYLPGRAAGWLLALVALGAVSFWAYPPARIQQGPRFNPLVYALDVLLPVVNLGQERAFTPADTVGQWLTYSLVAAGWVLATAVAAGVTRSLKRN
jgi:hypothetical protein